MQRRRGGRSRALWAAALALALHGAAVGGLVLLSWLPEPAWRRAERERRAQQQQAVALRELGDAEWEQNRRATALSELESEARTRTEPPEEPEPPKPEPEKRRELAEKRRGRVVDLGKTNGEAPPPDEARFSAEHDSRVERETVARDPDRRAPNAAAERTSPLERPTQGRHPIPLPMVAGSGGRDGVADDPRPSSRRTTPRARLEVPSVAPQEHVALRAPEGQERPGAGPEVPNREGRAAVQGNGEALRLQPGTESGDADAAPSRGQRGTPGLGVANLLPSQAAMDAIVAGAQDLRHEDVEEGDATFLNAVGWKHAGFFNRFRRQVAEEWHGPEELFRRDRTGAIYGNNHATLLHVALDARGRVQELVVLRSSGFDFLDRAALEAVEKAQPYPNPPSGLQDAGGRFQFPFFFIIDGDRPRIRFAPP